MRGPRHGIGLRPCGVQRFVVPNGFWHDLCHTLRLTGRLGLKNAHRGRFSDITTLSARFCFCYFICV